MRVVRLVNGVEIRIPLDQIESIMDVEPVSGEERPIPPHPYIHREGVKECAACWKEAAHPSHTETAVRG
jgi:hypothetical protein